MTLLWRVDQTCPCTWQLGPVVVRPWVSAAGCLTPAHGSWPRWKTRALFVSPNVSLAHHCHCALCWRPRATAPHPRSPSWTPRVAPCCSHSPSGGTNRTPTAAGAWSWVLHGGSLFLLDCTMSGGVRCCRNRGTGSSPEAAGVWTHSLTQLW